MPSPLRLLRSPACEVIAMLERPDGPPMVVGVAVVGKHENDISTDASLRSAADVAAHVSAVGAAGGELLIVDVKSPARARQVTRAAVAGRSSGVSFGCRTREAFFSVLAELGVDAAEVVRLAQAYPLLDMDAPPIREGVTGHAHRLLEAIVDSQLYRWVGFSPTDKERAGDAYRGMAGDIAGAVKIDLNTAGGVGEAIDHEAACRLPYPLCLFEYPVTGANAAGEEVTVQAIALVRQDGDWLRAAFFRTHPPGERYFFTCMGASWALQEGRLAWVPDLFTEEPPSEIAENWHAAVGAFLGPLVDRLAWINRPGVRLGRIAGPPKLTRARVARGLPPIFDYHVVTEAPPSASRSGEPSGRAAPRLHERRGHYRMLPGGTRVWVRSAVVGGQAGGVIGKEVRN